MRELFHLPETPPQRQETEAELVPSAREVSAPRDGRVLPLESPVYSFFLKLCFKEKADSLQPQKSPILLLLTLKSSFLSSSQLLLMSLPHFIWTPLNHSRRAPLNSPLPSAHTLLPLSPSHYPLLSASSWTTPLEQNPRAASL